MNSQEIAAQYRARTRDDEATGGYVLIYLGRAVGWTCELTRPETVCPGALAVDVDGQVFEAQGGNDYDGALRWAASPVIVTCGEREKGKEYANDVYTARRKSLFRGQ